MLKKNKKLLIITSLVILLPILAGIFLWNRLPDQMPTHWNAAGEIDDWSSKEFAVFVPPLILLAGQWVCILATFADPKRAAHGEKILQLVLWILPSLSVVLHFMTYAAAMGVEVRMGLVMPLVLGLMFTIIGNYLPKCKQNYTIGIKLPWTLDNEENWNKTHRLAGRLWMICGLAIMLTSFLGSFWVMITVLLVMVFVPVIYSYLLHRRTEM